PGATTDHLDGLTVEHWSRDARPEERWWFSLRSSNTEPLLRLNVEAQRETTMIRIRDEILAIVQDENLAGAQDDDVAGTRQTDLAGAQDETSGTSIGAADPGPAVAARPPADGTASAAGSGGAELPGWLRSRLRCPDCGGELADAEAALRCTQCARQHPVE